MSESGTYFLNKEFDEDSGNVYESRDWAEKSQLENITYQVPSSNGTDDTQTFQDAIDAGYKKIYVPKGTYYVNDLLIEDIELWGVLGSRIVVNDTSTTTEFSIGVKGKSYIHDLEFEIIDESTRTTLLNLQNCDGTVIRDCTLKAIRNLTGRSHTTLDLYRDNQNILVENVLIEQLADAEAGGVWIREAGSTTVTKNIKFINVTINKIGEDEALAIWGWNGEVRDIDIIECTFNFSQSPNSKDPVVAITSGQSGESYNIKFKGCLFNIGYILDNIWKSYSSIGSDTVIDDCVFILEEQANAGRPLFRNSDGLENFIIRNSRIETKGNANPNYVFDGIWKIENNIIKIDALTDRIFNGVNLIESNYIELNDEAKIGTKGKYINNTIIFNNTVSQIMFQFLSNEQVIIRGNKIDCAVQCTQAFFINDLGLTTEMMIENNVFNNMGIFANHGGVLKINDNNFTNFQVGTISSQNTYNNIRDGAFIASGWV